MADVLEIAVTSDSSGQLWNTCVWNPRTGTMLSTYKGGISAPHTLSLIGNDYLITGEKLKPLIHVWALNRNELQQRMVCPGPVNALSVSPSGDYCVASVEERLHVWQVSSGRLLAVVGRHYQTVSCIKFTDDGSHFVSGGDDGMIMVWPLAYLICETGDFIPSFPGQNEPRFIFSDHSLPVTDIHVGHGGMRARLASVSVDQTCKIYDLCSGTLLVSLVFDVALHSVALDVIDSRVFVGGADGNIYQFNLRAPPRMQEYHLTKQEKGIVLSGHSKTVTCLSVSVDNVTLLSGSADAQVKVWNIPSQQCIRSIPHKGSVTNAFFAIAPKRVLLNDYKPSIALRNFEKRSDLEEDRQYEIEVIVNERPICTEEKLNYSVQYVSSSETAANHSGTHEEINKLKNVNRELYQFAVEKILKSFENTAPASTSSGVEAAQKRKKPFSKKK